MSTDDDDRVLAEGAQAIRKVRTQWVHELELIALKAKFARAKYEALRKEGFTVAESITMCTRAIEL